MSVTDEKMQFRKTLRELGFNSYSSYLNSEHWNSLKRKYKNQNKKKCYICKVRKGLHLHHKTYKNLGKEKFEDLDYLCGDCHGLIHEYANKGMISIDLSDLNNYKAKNPYRNISY